ncbi:TA system toxin CbtA family protein [Klebsiella pneumoniae]
MKTLPATTPQTAKLCLTSADTWQMLLTRLLGKVRISPRCEIIVL